MEEGGVGTEPIKCVVVGDGMVGKTSILISYTSSSFPKEYIPTVFDNFSQRLSVDRWTVTLHIWDTAGQEEYTRLRPLSYPKSDIILICFSVAKFSSFQNVLDKWIPEVRHHVPHAPIILVGNKIDLREPPGLDSASAGERVISHKEGRKLASRIQALKYLECSALTRKGIVELFTECAKAVITKKKLPPDLPAPRQSKSKFCLLL
ncbi:rac gtpase [Pelomyxa schiedti]|nr:rac gtpase [Pelomyxa schiedti]